MYIGLCIGAQTAHGLNLNGNSTVQVQTVPGLGWYSGSSADSRGEAGERLSYDGGGVRGSPADDSMWLALILQGRREVCESECGSLQCGELECWVIFERRWSVMIEVRQALGITSVSLRYGSDFAKCPLSFNLHALLNGCDINYSWVSEMWGRLLEIMRITLELLIREPETSSLQNVHYWCR